jgi:hypothetical protein
VIVGLHGDIVVVVRRSRLRWYGHVVCIERRGDMSRFYQNEGNTANMTVIECVIRLCKGTMSIRRLMRLFIQLTLGLCPLTSFLESAKVLCGHGTFAHFKLLCSKVLCWTKNRCAF